MENLMDSLKLIQKETEWLKPRIRNILNGCAGWVPFHKLQEALVPYMDKELINPDRVLRYVLKSMVREGIVIEFEPIGGNPLLTKYVLNRKMIALAAERSSLSGQFEQPEKEVDKLLNPRRKIRLDD